MTGLRFGRYFFARRAPYPIYLIFFITSRCMGKCLHCFYWRELNKEEKPLEAWEVERAAKSMGNLLQVTLTGGEPLLREDLADLLKIFYHANRPLNLGLATSGFFPERLESVCQDVLSSCPESAFTVGLPLEGVGELNDHIRGVEGFFERTLESHARLKRLKARFPRLNILLDITVSGFNQDHLEETYIYARDKMKPDLINLILTRGDPRVGAALEFDPGKVESLLHLMERDIRKGLIPGYGFFRDVLHAKDIILRRVSAEIFRTREFKIPCTAGRLAGVIYPEGDLYPCELLPEKIGNLREENYNVSELWKSKRAEEIRNKISDTRCTCYHQCFLSPSIFFNPLMWPRLAREWLRIKL
jgi:radical SAM protein with 4Fe4S-binding SPASM domain